MILESPYSRSFRTNYAPSPQQVQEIKQMLREPEKKLRALEEEIAKLQAQRDDLRSFVDNHRSLLSPIRRVHSDILREIFVRCIPEDHLPVRNLREAPLLLTGICRSWREIAISTPRLWNRIHISLPHPRFPPVTESFRSLMRIRAEGLELWLDRAGGLPLSLSFHAAMPSQVPMSTREHTWRWDQQNLHDLETLYLDFTRCLLAYSTRWGNISLTVPHCIRKFLETYRFGTLDLLKSFRSAHPIHTSQAQMRPWHGIFERAHSLHILHLDEPHSDIPIPWGNLTELSLFAPFGDYIAASEAAQLLSLCTSLRWCNLHIRLGSTSHVAPATSLPVVLPYLHSANFSFLSSPYIHPGNLNDTLTTAEMEPVNLVFDAVTTPALKYLSISVFSATSIVAPIPQLITTSPFLSFVERSGCALSELVLNLPAVEDRLVGLLDLTPSLSAFTIVKHGNRSMADPTATGLISLLGALTPDSTHTDVLCPLLEEITLMHCVPEEAESLLELAEARCGPSDDPEVVRLKNMSASFGTFLDGAEDVSCRLQVLRDRGMTVRWSSPLDRRGQLQDDSPLRGFSRPPGIATRDRIFISENSGQILNEHLY